MMYEGAYVHFYSLTTSVVTHCGRGGYRYRYYHGRTEYFRRTGQAGTAQAGTAKFIPERGHQP